MSSTLTAAIQTNNMHGTCPSGILRSNMIMQLQHAGHALPAVLCSTHEVACRQRHCIPDRVCVCHTCDPVNQARIT